LLDDLVVNLRSRLRLPGGEEVTLKDFKPGSDKIYLDFLDDLASLKGVLFSSLIHTPDNMMPFYRRVKKHDNKWIPALRNPLANESSMQLYLQANVFCELINSAIWGCASYFSRSAPTDLTTFNWLIDQKDVVMLNPYHDFAKLNVVDYVAGERVNNAYAFMPGASHNLQYFLQVHCRDKPLNRFDLNSVLNHFNFVDSKDHAGIQIVGILAAGIRRCLKQEWDSNEREVCAKLGRLMLNQPSFLQIEGRSKLLGAEKRILPVSHKFENEIQTKNSSLEIIRQHARKFEER
jgi:hypothetical protein